MNMGLVNMGVVNMRLMNKGLMNKHLSESRMGSRLSCKRAVRVASILCAVLIMPALLAAQSAETKDFLYRAFHEREFNAKRLGPVRWMNDGAAYSTLEPSPTTAGSHDLVRYETSTGKRDILIAASDLVPSGAKEPLQIEEYDWSTDMNRALIYTNSRRVWRMNSRGDYWLFDRQAKTLRKLGGDAAPSTLMFATFSPDGSRIAYVRANNIYLEDAQSGKITALTKDGSDTIVNGTSDWVYEEELDIRDAFRWSPDGKRIAYWQFNTSGVKNFPLIYNAGAPYEVKTHVPYPEYGFYPVVKDIPYPEPGTPNSSWRIGVVKITGGKTEWMQVPGDSTNSYIARMDWAGNAETLIMQHLNRLQNVNDVLLADANTGKVTTVYSDHDKAWVDVVNDLKWVHGGSEFLWISEQDGWQHVYRVSRDGKHVQIVTPGAYDVISVLKVSSDEKWLYYIASPENATQRYLYRIAMDGNGTPERLTPADEPGTHAYDVSPDAQWAFHTYSTFDTPQVTNLVHFPDQHVARELVNNDALRDKLKPYMPQPVEFTHVDIGGGVVLDAWIVKPRNFDPTKKYPVLVYIYGEPAGQTVTDAWEGERGLFHAALAKEGYVILSVDNRGTPAPRGSAWRKVIYGSVGVLSSQEQASALKVLEQTHSYIDSTRIAIWGWSGGGSNTLNMMFRSPDLYKVGMSVAPVADQRLYDSIYQERFMGLPQDNPDGYRSGSAINFAEGLKGNLLIVHSPDDDNVHFQGTELLINRLVELGKPFDFMEYPGRTHSLSEGQNTHYHLYSLLARYLTEHLPPGPAAQ